MQHGTDCYVNSGRLNHSGDYNTYYTVFKLFEKLILFHNWKIECLYQNTTEHTVNSIDAKTVAWKEQSLGLAINVLQR